MFGVASLFIYISFNIEAKSVCVSLPVKKLNIHDALADTMSFLND